MLFSYVTRATHLCLSLSALSARTLCGMPTPWMVSSRITHKTVDIQTFFSKESKTTPLILLGIDAAPPPRVLVDMAQRFDWNLMYPSLAHVDLAHDVKGRPGPPSHQRRHRFLTKHEYATLCRKEDAIALDIKRYLENHAHVVAIVPSRFISGDSLPSRLLPFHPKTLSLAGGQGFVGEWMLLPSSPSQCSTI